MKDELPTIVVTDKKTEEDTATLQFCADERFSVEKLISIVHKLRKRDDIDAEQLHSIASVLRGLERLPIVTDGLSITIMLMNRATNGNYGYFSFFLCFDHLELAVGECIDSGVGFEHQVLNNLRIGLGWRRHDGIETCWDEWLDEFARRADDETIEVSIEDNDSDIDWYASRSGAEFWDAMPERYF